MQAKDVLTDAYGRILGLVKRIAGGLDAEALGYRPDVGANSIAWLLWHLTRVQDDHVSEISGREQAWVVEGWAGRFGMPADPANTGYGHSSEDVQAIRPKNPDVLVGYHEAVFARTLEYLETVDATELDRIVDRSWDPPVSVGVRLVSVIGDSYQHAGQAAYIAGMIERRG